MKAYLITDLATPVATTTTDGNGRYTLILPDSVIGKDLVIVATKDATRLETLVCDVAGRDVDGVDLDNVTTVAGELVLATARAATPTITDLDGSAFATIARELAGWSGIGSVSCDFPNNPDLQDTLAAGLKTGTPLWNFTQTSSIIQAALANLRGTGNAEVLRAKGMVQWIRDMLSTIEAQGQRTGDSIDKAVNEQQRILNAEIQTVAAVQQRTRFVQEVLGLGEADYHDTLNGAAPGQYTYDGYQLQRVGNAPDGKSWVVRSVVQDESKDTELTITPQNPMNEFNYLNSAARQLTITVRNTRDATFRMDGTMSLSSNAQGYLTGITLNVTMSHQSLSSSVTFNGSLTGEPVGQDAYKRINMNGDLATQWFTAKLTNVAATWQTSNKVGDLAKLEAGEIRAETRLSKPATVAFTGVVAEMDVPDPANGFPDPTPKRIAMNSASLTASGHTVRLTNATATGVRKKLSDGSVIVLPNAVQGQISYQGPEASLSGSINASWTNPVADFELGVSPASDFPKGTARLEGSFNPRIGVPSTLDVTLTTDNAVTSGHVTSTITVSALSALGERLSGSVQFLFPVLDGAVQDKPAVNASFTHSPSGYQFNLSQPAGSSSQATGTIKNAAGTKVADIGPASSLGLPDLGNAAIVKYADGSFETLASLVPGR